ncbi:TnsA-like heteromeric transposase endonuclease subunit [Nocardia sp. NPDC049707]|uniref:TnsA-like heteromeric transposase endonuclease subunit n=1 Tax=Nocardia sp. NPDC049707 TaxID=3154735 RepID=UPI0034305AF1
MRFEDMAPVRGFPSFRGQKNFPGLWWSATMGSHVGYESWLERDWLMAFDSSPEVAGVASQPFRLAWLVNGKTRHHVPDYFLRLHDGGVVVVDVRPDSRIDPDDQAVFDRTAVICESVGWQYRRVGEMGVVRAANLRWLSGYRHPRCRRPGLMAQFSEVFAAPRPLADGVAAVGDPIVVLPTLFHLLWRQELSVDLEKAPLGPDTIIGGDRQ